MTRKQEVLQATRGHGRQIRSRAGNVSLGTELREIDSYPTPASAARQPPGLPPGQRYATGLSDYDTASGYSAQTDATRATYSSTSRAPSRASRRPPQGLQHDDGPYAKPYSDGDPYAKPYSDGDPYSDDEFSLRSDFKFDPRSRSSSKQTDPRSSTRHAHDRSDNTRSSGRSRKGHRGQSPGRGYLEAIASQQSYNNLIFVFSAKLKIL